MERSKKQITAIIIIVLMGCGVMAVTDAVIQPVYAIKSAVKLVVFLGIPIAYSLMNREIPLRKMLVPNKKGFFHALLLGVIVYAVILGAYFIVRNFYDFSAITGLLSENVGVSRENFLWVALYISFVNSLLEEFFFRGFAFLAFMKFAGKKTAYLFSAVMFAVYHVAIMTGWFSAILFVLAMLGLTVGALIFNYLDDRNGNIYCSWMVHMFANFAINTVGFILFGML